MEKQRDNKYGRRLDQKLTDRNTGKIYSDSTGKAVGRNPNIPHNPRSVNRHSFDNIWQELEAVLPSYFSGTDHNLDPRLARAIDENFPLPERLHTEEIQTTSELIQYIHKAEQEQDYKRSQSLQIILSSANPLSRARFWQLDELIDNTLNPFSLIGYEK